MSKISDLTGQALRDLIGNMSYSKAVLAINAASAATVKTTGALAFSINGVQLTKAALAAQSIAITHTDDGRVAGNSYVQPALTTVYYTLGVNAAGTISVTQGTYAGQLLISGQAGSSYAGDGSVPNAPAGYVPFGVMKVATGAATTFTPATTLLDAALVTVTYFDVAVMPAGLL